MINELDELARKYGTDKRTNDPGQRIYHDYTIPYYDLFKDKKLEYKNVLEIGVREGWSHMMWRDFFPNATIYGIDNASECLPSIVDEENRIQILICSQDDKEKIEEAFAGITFDLIIDDGSHMSWHQQKTFSFLFPKLNPGGFYIFEDLGVCYGRQFREFDRFDSSTLGWLEAVRNGILFSFYIDEETMNNFYDSIKNITIAGELGIIEKRL
jgi:hypothetical protein